MGDCLLVGQGRSRPHVYGTVILYSAVDREICRVEHVKSPRGSDGELATTWVDSVILSVCQLEGTFNASQIGKRILGR